MWLLEILDTSLIMENEKKTEMYWLDFCQLERK